MRVLHVEVTLGASGVVHQLRAHGHVPGEPSGRNTGCAAATALVRTAARVLAECAGISISGSAPVRGELSFNVVAFDQSRADYLRAVSDFVVQGLRDLNQEHPGAVYLTVRTEGEIKE